MVKQKFRNEVVISGRLFTDPKFKEDLGPNKSTLCSLSLNYIFITRNDKESRTIFSVEAWNDVAEQCRGLRRDDCIEITGRNDLGKSYTLKGDENSRRRPFIYAVSLRRLDSEGNYLDEDSGSQEDEPSEDPDGPRAPF